METQVGTSSAEGVEPIRPVTAADIDVYARVQEMENKRTKLGAILAEWGRQQTQDRSLRKQYAKWIIICVFAQLASATLILFLTGFGCMTLDKHVATVFFSGVFIEVIGMTLIVLKYLFPESAASLATLVEQV